MLLLDAQCLPQQQIENLYLSMGKINGITHKAQSSCITHGLPFLPSTSQIETSAHWLMSFKQAYGHSVTQSERSCSLYIGYKTKLITGSQLALSYNVFFRFLVWPCCMISLCSTALLWDISHNGASLWQSWNNCTEEKSVITYCYWQFFAWTWQLGRLLE